MEKKVKQTKKSYKVTYNWFKLDFSKKGKVIQLIQREVFDSITVLLFESHGYKTKEVKKQSNNKDDYTIEIDGTIQQCQKHLHDLNNIGSNNIDKIKLKLAGHRLIRLLPKGIRNKLFSTNKSNEEKIQSLCDKLLVVGISLDISIKKNV